MHHMSKIRVGRLAMSSAVVGLLSVAGACSCDSDDGAGGASGAAAFDGGAAVSGSSGSGGFAAVGGSGGSSGSGGSAGTGTCADANITATNGIPTVWLLLDGSSSMQQDYGNTTRWRALRQALVGPNGVLRELDDVINFGMAIYAGRYVNGDPEGTGQCPIPGIPIPATMSTAVFENCNGADSGDCGAIVGTIAGQNFAQIEATLPVDESPGERTPSGEALNWLYDQLDDGIREPDGEFAPVYVIYATDGEPNSCSGGGGQPTFQLSEDAIARGRDLNITTYVVSLAQGNDLSDRFAAHLQRMANLGAGLGANASPGATLYSPQDPEALATDLETLLSATLGCSVPLRGTVDVEMACRGTVTLNSQPLACNDPNGWSVDSTGRILELAGSACTTFQNTAAVMVNASFPCDTIVPD